MYVYVIREPWRPRCFDAQQFMLARRRTPVATAERVLIDIEGFNYNIGAARDGIYDRRRVARISKLY